MAKLCGRCKHTLGLWADQERPGWYCRSCGVTFFDDGGTDEAAPTEGAPVVDGVDLQAVVDRAERDAKLESGDINEDGELVLKLPPPLELRLRPGWEAAIDAVVGTTAAALEGGMAFDDALAAGKAAGEAVP